MDKIVLILSLISTLSFAQSGTGRQIIARMQKGDWEKAEQIVFKAIHKDSLNIEAKYIASLLFYNPSYPKHNIDSSHRYILSALAIFSKTTPLDREKLSKISIDSSVLINHKEKVDSIAFKNARLQNTENGYLVFLRDYPDSKNSALAIELRNEAAFAEALKINTYQSFGQFLNKYPSSRMSVDAQKRYDQLLYEDRTKDGRLNAYENFVKENPLSSYRTQAEKEIFEIATAGGSVDSFKNFIKNYPDSKWSKQAINILFYIDSDFQNNLELVNDSLKHVIELNSSYWVPFIKGGRYGFMDQTCAEKLSAEFEDILPEYLCGNIQTDYLIVSKGIISRNGKFLFEGEIKNFQDLGSGFLKVESNGKSILVHKSGFQLLPEMVEAFVLDERFLAVKKNSGWGIVSFTGKELLPFVYEQITSFDNWIVLTKNSKKIIITADQLGLASDKNPIPETFVFDEVKKWAENLCWVKNDALEGILDKSLQFVIPLDRQSLSKTSFGFLRTKEDQIFIEGIPDLQNIPFNKVTVHSQWLSLQTKPEPPQLFSVADRKKITDNADSIWFDKNIAFVKADDSVSAWLNSHLHLSFKVNSKTILFSRDSSVWIVSEEKNKKVVYNALSGRKLFTGNFDQIESIAPHFFLITKANKKGLLDEKGKIVLPVEYDAIIQPQPDRLSLLKEKKLGLFDMTSRKLIKPAFERNVVQYNKNWFTAYKDGAWGFINADAKPQGKFQFEEIQYWNDSSAWIKENNQWKIYDIKKQKVLLDKVRNFQYIRKYPHEYLMIVHQENNYGVISNRYGTIIPINFTSLINLGDADTPLFFTEKHVAEADIFVVIYYDGSGKLLRKQAFDSEEYDRIFCEDN